MKSEFSASPAEFLIVFLAILSLATLEGPLSTNFHLPTVPLGRAILPLCQVSIPGICAEYWFPSGPAEDTMVATIFTDEQAEFTNIQSANPVIDFTDWPLTPDLVGPFTTSSSFRITSTASEAGYFEIQFMLANNFWGCNFNFGNAACGIQIRQGIAHMIDTAKFAANEPSISGQAVALDTPNPSDNIGSLPTANPCAWDTSFPETGSNCIVGAPGGTAYHLGPAAGANGISWLQSPGSKDLNAAAQHFVNAGVASGFNSTTSVLTGINSAALAHASNFFIRNDNTPRLHLGDTIAQQICYLFTGSYIVPCAYLTGTHAPLGPFPGFTTSTTNVIPSWGIYTAAYNSPTGPLPFDSSLYFRYNSRFVSGIPSIQPPNGPCASTAVPTVSAPDYMYLCNANYDSLTSQMEFAPCLTTIGDPIVGEVAPSVPPSPCPGTAQYSAILNGYMAEDQFGKNAYTLPIFEQNVQFGYLNNGWIRVIDNVGVGLPNYFTWLNTWNPSPVQPGTIRQGFKESTSSASPFVDSSPWDEWIVGNVYDSLTVSNPYSGGQLIDWMALSVQKLSNPSLTYTPPAGTTASFRFTLRSDMFFQDGRKVTSFDVAFSYLALKATGAYIGGGAAPMTGITILGPSQFDINVNPAGPFTLQTLSSLPILPGAYWTSAGSSTWSRGISACAATGAACYPSQYTLAGSGTPTVACALSCASFPASLMNVNLSQTAAGYDPIVNHTFVGSGPWQCGTVTSSGSGSCTSSATQNPFVGGNYTLTRFGKGLAPASSVSDIYFRSNGNLAAYLWSQDTGDITHDFLNFSVVASCFGAAVTSMGACAHFQKGIGANGGPIPVSVTQVTIVDRFVGLNWIAPFIWASTPPLGIIPLPPVLYENTITLNPAAIAGCTTPYPTGGYDC